jgi:hypothetical protein
VLVTDLARLISWPDYWERAVRMANTIRVARICTITPDMKLLMVALVKTMPPAGEVFFLGACMSSSSHCPRRRAMAGSNDMGRSVQYERSAFLNRDMLVPGLSPWTEPSPMPSIRSKLPHQDPHISTPQDLMNGCQIGTNFPILHAP